MASVSVQCRGLQKNLSAEETTDINAGCPQTRAMEGGYGSAFLVQKEWSVLESLGEPASGNFKLVQDGSSVGTTRSHLPR